MTDRWLNEKSPDEIIETAVREHTPVAFRVGFSGGRDSMAITHWMLTNLPGTTVVHCHTGIGIEKTREFVRETCQRYGWPLEEIRAKEDCGQDYDEFCKLYGFPGPDGHGMMYARLKERPIREMVRRAKVGYHKRAKVLISTGIRHDESTRRMRYVGREINHVGSQLWTNPIYWWSATDRDAYIAKHNLPINPISALLGMSGECLCGAFAHKGEKSLVRIADPRTADRIDALEQEVFDAGWNWGWEGKPPIGGASKDQTDMFRPLCVGCEK